MKKNPFRSLKTSLFGIGAVIVCVTTSSVLYAQTPVDKSQTVAENSSVVYSPKFERTRPEAAASRDKADPAPGSNYDWSGFYIGGHAGYGWGNADTNVDPLPSPGQFFNLLPSTLKPDPRGFLAGVQGGYNWQKKHLVVGAEADLSWTDIKGTQTVTPIPQNNGTPFPGAGFFTSTQKTSYLGTVRPRLGVAFDRLLVYATGGLAYARIRNSANTDFRPVGTTQYAANISKTKFGLAGGFGAEFGLTKHISWKGEVLFTDFPKESVTVDAVPSLPPFQVRYRWQSQATTVNSGINFRF